jgi:hypothetical protein
MHRTSRQPAAKVAPARPPSTWKARRGRGAEAAGAIVWRSFCTALCGRFDASVWACFFSSKPPGMRQPDPVTMWRAARGDETETRVPAHRDLRSSPSSDADLTVTAPHVDGISTAVTTDMQAQWHTTQNAHGARRPNPHQPPGHQLNSQGLNRGTTGPSSPYQSQSQARTGHPASK